MIKTKTEAYQEPPEIDWEKVYKAGDKVSQAAANFAKNKLSQFSSPQFNSGSVAGGVQGMMKELVRSRAFQMLLGTGETRTRRLEKIRAYISDRLKNNPNLTSRSMLADILSKMVKKESWIKLFGEDEEFIPPSDSQLHKKSILVEPPSKDQEIDEDVQSTDLQMSDGSDVPLGPYRTTGRDPEKTNIPIEGRRMRSVTETLQFLFEQEKEESIPRPEKTQGTVGIDSNDVPDDPNMTGQDSNDTRVDPNAVGGDPNAMGMNGMGMNQTDMGQDPNQLNADQLGRIFELKKIYRRLESIEAYLSFSSDPELTEISSYVSKAIEFFELLSSNLQQFKDKIDGIIIVFYEFLNTIYDAIKSYYEKREQKDKGNIINAIQKLPNVDPKINVGIQQV